MAETTRNDKAQEGADLAAAMRDRGMEQMEGAKGQLADGAERVAAAVERTADELQDDGDNAISGFGHSVASLMRQLAGGLRERDIEDFARELAALARRNPGVFLAGSVALGFGIARFFKAGTARSSEVRGGPWQSSGEWQGSQESTGGRAYGAGQYNAEEYDAEERLDLSASSTQRSEASQSGGARGSSASQGSSARDAEQERNASKSRQSGKNKGKPQRAASGGSQPPSGSSDPPPTDTTSAAATTDADDSAFTGGTGGGALHGGKS
ncbi:MAG TPA: hypothetical protein VFL30_03985 [Rhodanobacteraceae bacterium]|nr:hypothetical protein [Rhodanobacteraceae bacterium]